MKYFSLVIVAVFVMWAGFCGAEEAKKTEPIAKAVPVAEESSDDNATPVDADISGKEDDGVTKENLMPPGQTYDTNTGMPNMVGSDTAGEIE